MEAKIGKSYLTGILHEGKEISFQYPAFIGYYENVANAIDKDNLRRPNSSETASLVYDAWKNPKEKYSAEIISILKDNWLWEYTGNLYLPKAKGDFQNGVLIQDNPLIVDGKLVMDKNDLIKKLEDAEEFRIGNHPIFISKDRSVRFTPFGYKIDKMKFRELAENPYIVAQRLGRKENETEHSEALAKIASKYKNKPYLNSFNSVDREEARMSVLKRNWDDDGMLIVDGNNWFASGDDGVAFGVCKD